MYFREGRAAANVEKLYQCRACPEQCGVLVVAAVKQSACLWKCPMMLGTELMDRAVALALIQAALGGAACVVIRISDVDTTG